MYLSQVKITNFRLFSSLTLTLNRGINVLVGENDSGKTALVDAIRYVLGTNSNDRAYIAEQDFHKDTNDLTIQLKFSDVGSNAHRFVEHLSHEEYEDEQGDTKRRSVLYVQLHAQKTGLERRGYPYIKTDIRSGVGGSGTGFESEIRDFLASTYLKPMRDAEAEMSSGRASRLSQILSSSKNIKEGMESILSIVAQANASLLADDAALKSSAKYIQEEYLHKLIFEQEKANLGAYIDLAGIKADGLAELPENIKKRHLRTILEGLSLALTSDQRTHGLGYHNLLFMGAELLLLEQEADSELPLLLVEEPEAHLHPQLQMKLLQFINSMAKTQEKPNGVQCILTTHSPNISSKADPSQIIMLSGCGAYPLRENETELGGDDYKYLRKFLDATKANIFFAKSIIFVEGDGENILLPELARLLGRPLEDYGVSIVKYDNAGSWKRFARLFLRAGQDENQAAWNPVKVCVLRDLDLWPDCAEAKVDGSNPYGFKDVKPNNQRYWLNNYPEKQERKEEHMEGLNRQNIAIKISDDWTFEYCLAKHGLFDECFEAIAPSSCDRSSFDKATDDERATYILSKVSKTDFAYDLADILQRQLEAKVSLAVSALNEAQSCDDEIKKLMVEHARLEFSLELKSKLPRYIVEAVEHVTSSIPDSDPSAN